MTADERHQLLVEWNHTGAGYPRERCLHELFDAQVERSPDAIALRWRDVDITYRELQTRSNQLAHHLRRRGVRPGVLVGVSLERSPDAIVALLGVLKAGGAYVPVDPAYPEERRAFMLRDSGAPVLLTVQRLAARVAKGAAEVIALDTDWNRIGQEGDGAPVSGASPDDLAYVIYTSGSTGRPKGVLAGHRASVNRLSWMWSAWPFAPDDVCCQKTPLSFVDSVSEIFGPLLQGIPTVIIPEEDLPEPDRLVQALSRHRVTRIVLVPSLLRLVLDRVPNLRTRIPDLRLWVTSGETIPPPLARRFEDALPTATLLNLYGSSEVAGDVTCYVTRNAGSLARIPIGRPIANTRIYILDSASQPVPVGVTGEIHVGGDNLARGYLNNPELTADKFIRDPFTRDPGARLYRTGDLGRFLPDGNIELLGRVDAQVKVRGVRIELGDVESTLRTHPAIRATVVMVSGADGDERLIAYVVSDGATPAPADLRRFAREKLPEQFVPAAFVTLDTLPLLPNGKVDRQALAALSTADARVDRDYVGPRTDAEARLAGIFAEVLRLERVGVHDDFFELGGHSLVGAQVVARVRNVFQVELPLRALFEEPTVAGLCHEIAKAPPCAAAPVASPLRVETSSRAELLAKLDRLSDEDVRALLGLLPRESGENRTEDL
jgi:amino acid adenylation domain-containing protein